MSLKNIEACRHILQTLSSYGLSEIVFCAGSRNAPFISLLEHLGGTARTYSFFEERSAAFFALGRSRALGFKPVAVVTTSGTAAAELLPACIEAFYSGVPLVLITCDRPRRLRGTGAPQTIEQTGLMSKFVEREFDLEGETLGLNDWSLRAPLHINVCLGEPLLDERVSPWTLHTSNVSAPASKEIRVQLPEAERPLIIIGGLETPSETQAARTICNELGWPVYAEACSGLRDLSLRGGEQFLSTQFKKFDFVLRLGSVPTTRLWRDLEDSKTRVTNVTPLKFAGVSRGELIQTSLSNVRVSGNRRDDWSRQIRDLDEAKHGFNLGLFEKYPLAEPSLFRKLSVQVANDFVYVGNSLPIREWDFAAMSNSPKVFANRGANGIDGQLSTYLGLTDGMKRSWCITGDLTTMYDLAAPWAPSRGQKIFIVINNGGGKIFHRMYRNPMFENNHERNFAGWAQMWNLDYQISNDASFNLGERSTVVEFRPSLEQTELFWNELSESLR